jgi:cytochrome c-type biogenesis protein CcmH
VSAGHRAIALMLALFVLAPAATAAASAPQTSLPDVEDEVMCPICGTLLELSESPQANRERIFIRRLIAEGKTKQQIKDELVDQYGRAVLATPKGSGFDLTAYVVPILAFLLAAIAIALGVRRWRRSGRRSQAEPDALSGEDAERLDADLARYDL